MVDFYQRKTDAVNKINELLDKKESYQNILLNINMTFGFGERMIVTHLKNLRDSGVLIRENVKLNYVNGVWSLEYEQVSKGSN